MYVQLQLNSNMYRYMLTTTIIINLYEYPGPHGISRRRRRRRWWFPGTSQRWWSRSPSTWPCTSRPRCSPGGWSHGVGPGPPAMFVCMYYVYIYNIYIWYTYYIYYIYIYYIYILYLYVCIYLAGGLEHVLFFQILEMSSSQLTNMFQRGGLTTNQIYIYIYTHIFVIHDKWQLWKYLG